MGRRMDKTVKWLPRILGLLFAAFLAMFALDSECVVGFLMHLIPSAVVLLCVAAGWCCPALGGVAMLLLGGAMTLFFHTYEDIVVFLIVSGPPFIIGLLFLAHWRLGRSSAPD